MSILALLHQRQSKTASPILSVRLSANDREKLTLIREALTTRGVRSPTVTDAVKWALETAAEVRADPNRSADPSSLSTRPDLVGAFNER